MDLPSFWATTRPFIGGVSGCGTGCGASWGLFATFYQAPTGLLCQNSCDVLTGGTRIGSGVSSACSLVPTPTFGSDICANFFCTMCMAGASSPYTGTFSNFVIRMAGFIHMPTSGLWTFYTESDDGSRLWIGRSTPTKVVENNYLQQPAVERSGTFNFASAGWNEITIE